MKNEFALDKEITLCTVIPPERFLSVFLIIFGLILGVLPQFATNRDEVGPLVMTGLFIVGSLIIYGGIRLAVAAKRLDVTFNKVDKTIFLKQKRWFSSESEIEQINADQIAGFDIETKTDSDSDNWYHVNLKLKSGRKVAISTPSMAREDAVKSREMFRGLLQDEQTPFSFSTSKHPVPMEPEDGNTSKFRRLAWFVIGLVVSMPFLAVFAADHMSFPSIVVSPGVPDAYTLEKVTNLAAAVLKPSEHILWVGQPELGRESSLKMWLFIPFAIIWTLFSLLWTAMASTAIKQSKVGGTIFTVFGVPFVLIGVGMLCTPYFTKQQELTTVYMLSDKGAIKVVNSKPYRMVEYDEADFGPVEVTRYKPNRADILFIKDSSEGEKHPYGGFYGIENADGALEVIDRHSK